MSAYVMAIAAEIARGAMNYIALLEAAKIGG